MRRHLNRSFKDRLCRAVNQPRLPTTVLSDPLRWYMAPGGTRLHASYTCSRLNVVQREQRLLALTTDILEDICPECLDGLDPDVLSYVKLSGWLDAVASDSIDGAVAGRFERGGPSSWTQLGRAWSTLVTLVSSAGDLVADMADDLCDYRSTMLNRLELTRSALLSDPRASEAQFLEIFAGSVARSLATTAAEAAVGIAPSLLFRANSAAWSPVEDAGHFAWKRALASGASAAAAHAEAIAAMTVHIERSAYMRGEDPGVLAFTCRDFDTPSAWADAEHQEALRQAVAASAGAWADKLDELSAAREGDMLAVASEVPGGSALPTFQACGLWLRYGAEFEAGVLTAVVPAVVVPHLTTSPIYQSSKTRPALVLGAPEPGDTPVVYRTAFVLAEDLPVSEALSSARLLTGCVPV